MGLLSRTDLGLVYCYSLPDDIALYKKYKRFTGNVTVSNLIYALQKYFLCVGCTVSSEKLINHIVTCKTDINKLDTSPVSFKQYRRSHLCEVLMLDMTKQCDNCNKFEEKHKSLVTKHLLLQKIYLFQLNLKLLCPKLIHQD